MHTTDAKEYKLANTVFTKLTSNFVLRFFPKLNFLYTAISLESLISPWLKVFTSRPTKILSTQTASLLLMNKVPELLGETDIPCYIYAVHSWQVKYSNICPKIDVAFPSENLFFSFLTDKDLCINEKSIIRDEASILPDEHPSSCSNTKGISVQYKKVLASSNDGAKYQIEKIFRKRLKESSDAFPVLPIFINPGTLLETDDLPFYLDTCRQEALSWGIQNLPAIAPGKYEPCTWQSRKAFMLEAKESSYFNMND